MEGTLVLWHQLGLGWQSLSEQEEDPMTGIGESSGSDREEGSNPPLLNVLAREELAESVYLQRMAIGSATMESSISGAS